MRRTVVLACLATLAACAPMDPAGPGGSEMANQPRARQCFTPSQVTNFRQGGDDRSIYLKVLNGDVFELQSGGCMDLNFANSIQITQELGDAGRVCVGDTTRLLSGGGSNLVNIPCRARVERRLTEAELAALPSRDRP